MRKPMRPALHPEMRPPMRPEMRPPMRPLTDEDGEVRELTREDFEGMRPLREVDPGFIEAMAEFRRKVGRPKADSPKVHISFRLAAEVVESIKATGEGYNARVEQALRDAFVAGGVPKVGAARRSARSGAARQTVIKRAAKRGV